MPYSASELTLRERIVAAIRLNRELREHLEQGFLPKVHSLRRATRSEKPESDFTSPGDKTVHAAAGAVLEADHFTLEVYQQLIAHCESIRKAVHDLTGERASQPGRPVGSS